MSRKVWVDTTGKSRGLTSMTQSLSGCDFSRCPHDLLVGKVDVEREPRRHVRTGERRGVHFERLDALIKRNSEGEVSEEEWEKEIEKAIETFTEGAALIYGTIAYSWRESTGSEICENLPFFTKVVYLTNARRYGLPKPPSFEYQAAAARRAEQTYQVRVPLSQEIKAGDSDRFNIRLRRGTVVYPSNATETRL